MGDSPLNKFTWMEALRGADLTHAEYRVLLNLSTFANGDLTNAFPGLPRLCESSRVSVPTAKKALRKLIEQGWIVLTEEGGNQHWKGKANVYSMTLPKGVTHLPPSPENKGVTHLSPSGGKGVNTEPEGGKPFSEGGKLTPLEGGNSLTPHQVLIPGHQTNASTPDNSSLVRNASASARGEEEPLDAEVVDDKHRAELDPGFRSIFGSSLFKQDPDDEPMFQAAEKQQPTWAPEPESEPEPLTPVEEVRRMRVDLSQDEEILAKELAALGHSKYEIVKEIDRGRRRRKNHPLPRRAG
ncbi:hypothetical protein JCM9803A_11870 [Rhodococcus erythropolis]